MQKYFNSVATSTNYPVDGASVLVKTLAGATATIYSDNGLTVAANPITTDALGYFEFYAADGRYTLEISKTGVVSKVVSDILLEDPANTSPIVTSSVTITNDGDGYGDILTNSDIGMRLTNQGAGTFQFRTRGDAIQAQIGDPGGSPTVNYLSLQGAIAGGLPVIIARGEANAQLQLSSNGTGAVWISTNGGSRFQFGVEDNGAATTNYILARGAATGATPRIRTFGAVDANVPLEVSQQGTATMKLSGQQTAASATAGVSGATPAQVAGYLVININGTDRKIPYYAT